MIILQSVCVLFAILIEKYFIFLQLYKLRLIHTNKNKKKIKNKIRSSTNWVLLLLHQGEVFYYYERKIIIFFKSILSLKRNAIENNRDFLSRSRSLARLFVIEFFIASLCWWRPLLATMLLNSTKTDLNEIRNRKWVERSKMTIAKHRVEDVISQNDWLVTLNHRHLRINSYLSKFSVIFFSFFFLSILRLYTFSTRAQYAFPYQ